MGKPSPKICAVCGREFAWRRKWADVWEDVRNCSAACRKRGLTEVDRELEAAILKLLTARRNGASICPNEAAKVVHAERGGTSEGWRELMEPARMAARRMVQAGKLVITQDGREVDPTDFKGPIRLTLPRRALLQSKYAGRCGSAR